MGLGQFLGQNLLEILLRQTIGEAGERLTDWLKQHLRDPTQTLPKALEAAHSNAWRCIELALAEPGLSAEIRRKTASSAIKALLQPLGGLLNTWSDTERGQALGELQRARTAGLLTLRLDAVEVARFDRLASSDALLEQAWQLIANQSGQFNAYPKLKILLTYHTPQGSLLLLALSYFLRQAILADETLREDLSLQHLRTLCQQQQQGFDEIKQLFAEQGAALAQAFTALANRMEERFDRVEDLLRDVQAGLARHNAVQGVLEPRLTHIITDPQECVLVRKLLERYRALPETQRRQHPELLSQLGKLTVANGDLEDAEQLFAEARTAEAHYNRHRVLLEQHRWADALAALLQAAQLDPVRFEPFPLRKYRIEKILGAGGFGVAFLCQDLRLAQQVVIKTLHTAILSRAVAEVFKEARALSALNDPRIVRLEHADYADTERQRPYLVMEYFAGQSLSEYLSQHGTLPADQAQALAVELAQALQAAHGAHILHRDIKPDNILVRRENQRWAIKLIDFGLAAKAQVVRETLAASGSHLTLLGASLGGTYQFSAPEQFNPSLGSVGSYSDVYGYGKTLCYALFGTADPTFDEWEALGGQHVLTRLLNSCIRDDLKRRPQNFGAVLTALQGTPAATAPQPAPTSSGSTEQRRRIPVLQDIHIWDIASAQTLQRDVAEALNIPVELPSDPAQGIPALILIPPGKFLMGSPGNEPERSNAEDPQHPVTLSQPFYLGKYTVTQQEWEAVLGSNPAYFKGANRPVENVSWNDIQTFLQKLNAKTGKQYRLPTEAEWEYACRVGTTTAFWWGNRITSAQANYDGNYPYNNGVKGKYREQTVEVNQFAANPWGLYQMHGNVWEWVQDYWHDNYNNGAPSDGSAWVSGDCGSRVLRGGSWLNYPRSLRAAFRNYSSPDNRCYYYGFRLALSPRTLMAL